jgi:hypothetical protein
MTRLRDRDHVGARAVVALPLVLLLSSPAAADLTRDQCVSANARAQDLRRSGKLSAAREQLRQCSDFSCPSIVRDDCTQRLDELEKAQPTIIFDVKDGSGRDLVDATATVDGQPLAHTLDGSALRMDPGAHVFVFAKVGQPSVTQTFVLKEGEKERRERIVIGAAATTASSEAPTSYSATVLTEPEEASRKTGMSSQRLVSMAVGGVGVAGIATGTVFGILAVSAAHRQKTACASPTICSNFTEATSDHSGGETDATVSNVTFIAGGALLAAGAILFFTAPHAPETPPLATSGLLVAPSVAPGGGGVSVQGEF